MEKWRIYLIIAGVLMTAYNTENINFDDLPSSIFSIVGVLASLIFVVMLIVFRKNK